jgi:hypothetical protein
MAGAIIGGTIAAAGSLAGAGMGMASSSAANKANQKMMERIWAIAQQGAAPYQKFGKAGMNIYQQMLPQLLSQQQYQQFTPEMYQQSPLYTPMVRNLAELQATPGYQFQLQQGQKQLDQQAAARGGMLSGAQLQAAQGFGQKQAATGFQDAWQRAQTAYQNAFNTYNQQYANQLAGANAQSNMLGDITKMGYTAAMGPTAMAQGMYQPMAASNLATGENMANIGMAGGKALGQYGGSLFNALYNPTGMPAAGMGGTTAGIPNSQWASVIGPNGSPGL